METTEKAYRKALKIQELKNKETIRINTCISNMICPVCGNEIKYFLFGKCINRKSKFWNAILGMKYINFIEPKTSSPKDGYDYIACSRDKKHYFNDNSEDCDFL